jgi:GTPase SAR1 family protein
MGTCNSTEEKKKSQEIDKYLNNDRKKIKEEIKLLLLGPGESGKSTIFKQMKIIQLNGGFSSEELQSYKYIVYGNCVTQMKVIVNAAIKLGIKFDNEENEKKAEKLTKVPSGGDAWSTELGQDIKALWKDSGIKKTYLLKDKQYQLNDSAEYFFENIDRFMEPSYIPTQADVLRVRVRSTGIEEAEFKFEDVNFRMVDVGGQRSERRKWIHCFDQVTAVIFCVALSEYDQTLREDDSQNRMKESLLLFDEVCNSQWFKNTAFILFLNKVDLFKEKIEKVDLKICFPNYTGGCNFDAASNFIKARFLEQNQSPHVIYTHFTCAINTENIQFVFKCVRETVLKKILNEVIMY